MLRYVALRIHLVGWVFRLELEDGCLESCYGGLESQPCTRPTYRRGDRHQIGEEQWFALRQRLEAAARTRDETAMLEPGQHRRMNPLINPRHIPYDATLNRDIVHPGRRHDALDLRPMVLSPNEQKSHFGQEGGYGCKQVD